MAHALDYELYSYMKISPNLSLLFLASSNLLYVIVLIVHSNSKDPLYWVFPPLLSLPVALDIVRRQLLNLNKKIDEMRRVIDAIK